MKKNGCAETMTCRRDRLSKDVSEEYFHKAGIKANDSKARCARFFHSMTAVKMGVTEAKTHTRTHVFFQFISSTNISTVDAVVMRNIAVGS